MEIHMLRIKTIAAGAVLACASLASAHNHLTVDTVATPDGPKIIIRAGYYPSEPGYAIDSLGRLSLNNQPVVIDLPDLLSQGGEFEGVAASTDLVLTSDYFFITGRLDGGNFMWEIAKVLPVDGGFARVTWGDFDESYIYAPAARSGSFDRTLRSFDTQVGGHNHDQGFTIGGSGEYEITLIAWDSNGVYLDSDPVTVRLRAAGPEPRCMANVNSDEATDFGDFLSFFNGFDSGDAAQADLDQNGSVDFADFLIFFNAFDQGC
jgi:hypothetical protein